MISKICLFAKHSHNNVGNLCVRHLRNQIPLAQEFKDSPKAEDKTENLTHFGFESIQEDEKTAKVYKVFEDVAQSYDLMNDVLSMGIHRVWKDILMEELGPTPGTKLLDMAGGTGDIAFRFLKYLSNIKSPEKKLSHLTIGDINEHMLNVGKGRAEKLGFTNPADCTVEWVCADAENLPFDSNSFTAYTISFGIRNCTRIDKVLSEAHRVLAPGGRFLCLEFSRVNIESLQKIYDKYSFQLIPPVGQILTGQWQHYQYLVESIRRFPPQEQFAEMIRSAGFNHVTYRDLTFGISAIHSGFKF